MARPRKEDSAEIEEPQQTDKIRFFGEIDLNDKGGIRSDMPAWYFERHIEDLEENIVRKEGQINRGAIEQDQVPMLKEQIKMDKARLKAIKESKPELSSTQIDRCYRVYKSLSEQIKDTMPTRKQAKDGLVNPYDELKRLKTKHIKVDTEIAAACGCHPVHGKITGDEANKMYQIIGKAIGENRNPEALRRDGYSEAYHTINDLTKAIIEGAKIKDG